MSDLMSRIRKTLGIQTRIGFLADSNRNVYETNSDGTLTGRYLVRLDDQLSPAQPMDIGWGCLFRPDPNRVLRIGEQNGLPVILGEDTAATRSQGDNPSGTNAVDGNLAGLIYKERIRPFYCEPRPTLVSNFSVSVYPDNIVVDNTIKSWAGGAIDLAGEIPASGSHRYTLVLWNVSTQALAIVSSTAQLNTVPLDDTDLQETIDNRGFFETPLWAFVIDGDDTTLSATGSVDLRDVAGTSGGIDLDIYFRLLGRAGGQVAYGGTGTGENLTFSSTSHATGGTIFFKGQETQNNNIISVVDYDNNVLSGTDERGILFSDGGIDVDSVYIGSNAGNIGHTNAQFNVGIGRGTLKALTTGDENVAVGYLCGWVLTTGKRNFLLGSSAGRKLVDGDDNIFIGKSAGFEAVSAEQNTYIGQNAGLGNLANSNVFIGTLAGGKTATHNTSNSVMIGVESGQGNDTGDNHTFIGYRTGRLVTTGTDSVLIGYLAGSQLTTESNLLVIANTNTLTPLIYGEFDNAILAVNGKLSVGANAPQANLGATNLQVEGGVISLKETTTPTADTNYGKIYTQNDNFLYWQNGAGTEKTIVDSDDTIEIPILFSMFDALPERASESNWNGGILSLATAQPLDSVPTDLVVTTGIGKLIIVVNVGSDIAGDITVTGTSVDRDTKATTPADTDTITVDALTTDSTTTDANGNTIHVFAGAYITSKWFTGTVTLSTVDLTLTDVDVYHVSFEQVNDNSDIMINTFDANILTTNVNAEFDAYLFTLHVTGDKCDIHNEASLNVGNNGLTAIAGKYWRLRQGVVNESLDGTTDGFWVDVHYANSPVYVEDVTLKVWTTKTQGITLV